LADFDSSLLAVLLVVSCFWPFKDECSCVFRALTYFLTPYLWIFTSVTILQLGEIFKTSSDSFLPPNNRANWEAEKCLWNLVQLVGGWAKPIWLSDLLLTWCPFHCPCGLLLAHLHWISCSLQTSVRVVSSFQINISSSCFLYAPGFWGKLLNILIPSLV
jgi:hypothetical protein